jgi:hypothetical protein
MLKLLTPAVKNIVPVSWMNVLLRSLVGENPAVAPVNVGKFKNAATLYALVALQPGPIPEGAEQ